MTYPMWKTRDVTQHAHGHAHAPAHAHAHAHVACRMHALGNIYKNFERFIPAYKQVNMHMQHTWEDHVELHAELLAPVMDERRHRAGRTYAYEPILSSRCSLRCVTCLAHRSLHRPLRAPVRSSLLRTHTRSQGWEPHHRCRHRVSQMERRLGQ